MKKILAMAAAAALAAGASAFAANPFSDVSTSDWAYQAVSDLSDQGIVEGYPDGTFKGQTNITRYEMAQIVARLMAKEDQYNAEQRATIDKLAAEYADELDSLGVRVSNLEKKVGNISWSGDARMRFQDLDTDDDTYKARVRLNMTAQVNDEVKIIGRFKTEATLTDDSDAQTTMDRLHALWQPTDRFSFDIGRTDLFLGQTGYLYDDRFQGVIAKYKADTWGAEIGYGREWKQSTEASDLLGDGSTRETFYVQANTKVGDRVRLNAFYQNFADGWGTNYEYDNDGKVTNSNAKYISGDKGVSLYGIGARIDLGGQFYIDGDFIQNTSDVTIQDIDENKKTLDKPVMWVAGLNYGKADLKNPGTFWMGVHYVDAEAGSYIGASTLDITKILDNSVYSGAEFWVAEINYALAKNISLDGYYYFGGDYDDGTDFGDMYGVELNYKF